MSSRRTLVSLAVLACVLAGLAFWFVRGRDDSSAEPSRGARAQVVDSTSSATQPSIDSLHAESPREVIPSTQALAPLDVGPAFGPEIAVLCTDRPDGAPLVGVVVHVWDPGPHDWFVDTRHGGLANVHAASVRANGTRVIADAQGVVRIPRPHRQLAILAEHGALVSLVRIDPEIPSPLTLVLVPHARFDVHVHDSSGTPAVGIDVTLLSLSGSASEHGRARTGATGLARIDCPVRARPDEDLLRIVALVAGAAPVEKRVRIGEATVREIELVVPRADTWPLAIVDAGGQVVPLWGELEISAPESEAPRPTGVAALYGVTVPLAAGRARVTAWPADVDVHVRMVWNGAWIEGWWLGAPRPFGAENVVQLAAENIDELLRLTVCDASGAPLSEQAIGYAFAGLAPDAYGTWISGTLRTDAGGRAALALEDPVPDGARLFLVDIQHEPERWAFVACSALRSAPGPRVVLAGAEVVLTGHVVTRDGVPIVGAFVGVAHAGVPGAPTWMGLGADTTDARGRFQVFGVRVAGELGVVVSKTERLDLVTDTGALRFGARDVELRVGELGSIEGSALVDPALREPLVVRARRAPMRPGGAGFADEVQTWRDGDLVRFRITSLRAGERDLEFTRKRIDGFGETEVVVAGVKIVGGSVTRDPRTQPIDLRAALAEEPEAGLSPSVRFVDARGVPVTEGVLVYDFGEDDWGPSSGWIDGQARISKSHTRFAAWAPGFAITVAPVPHAEGAICVLEPPPTIVLALDVPERLRALVHRCRVEIEAESGPLNRTSRQAATAELVDGRTESIECLLPRAHEVDLYACYDVDGDEWRSRVQSFTIQVSASARDERHVLKADADAWERVLREDGAPLPPR